MSIEKSTELSSRISAIRAREKLSMPQFAKRLGVTTSYVSAIEGGKNKKISETLIKLISYEFNIDPKWLETGEGGMEKSLGFPAEKISAKLHGIRAAIRAMQREEMPAKIPEIVNQVDDLERQLSGVRRDTHQFPAFTTPNELPDGFVLVPRYDVAAAAGHGTVIHSEQIVDSLAFRSSWIQELGLRPDALALISARGDSMTPTLNPGDLLLIDLSAASVHEDAIYAIQNDGTLIVKRVQKMFDGSIVIKSDNPAYREQVIDKGLLETVRIVGRVVWAGRRL